jgi:hypothetical protein
MVKFSKEKTFYLVETGSQTAESLQNYCARNGITYASIRKRFYIKGMNAPGQFYIIPKDSELLQKTLYEFGYEGMSQFAKDVLKAAKLAGSRPKLARILGVNRTTINGWIYGTSNPTPNNRELVKKYLLESDKYNGRFSFKSTESN